MYSQTSLICPSIIQLFSIFMKIRANEHAEKVVFSAIVNTNVKLLIFSVTSIIGTLHRKIHKTCEIIDRKAREIMYSQTSLICPSIIQLFSIFMKIRANEHAEKVVFSAIVNTNVKLLIFSVTSIIGTLHRKIHKTCEIHVGFAMENNIFIGDSFS